MILTICIFSVSCGESGNNETPKNNETTTDTGEKSIESGNEKESTTTNTTEKTTESSKISSTETTTKITTKTDDTEDPDVWNGKTWLPGYENVDFGDNIFLIASRTDESTGGWNNGREIWVEELTNDAINNSIYERNEVMKTLYKCDIRVDDGGWDNGFKADMASGAGKYIGGCAAYAVGSTGTTGFANGNFYNVLNLDIDFTQSWWDQAFTKDLSCNGKLYGLCGDFAYHAMKATWIMFYNKEIYANNFDEDIYQLVRDKKWTVDKMLEMCQMVTKDNNGDQVITYSAEANADMIGYVSTAHNIRGLYNACGEFYVTKDDNGKMICALGTGKGSDVIDKIRSLTTSESYLETGYVSVNQAMIDGTALFCGQVLSTLEYCAEYDGPNLGVVPQPLYDENQENYYHYVNNQAAFYAVPTSYSNMQNIADFYTLFAAHSQKIVRTAFINTYKYSYASDEESGEMLDIVLNTRTYDPGYHFNMALGFDGVLPSMCSKDGKNQFSAASKRYESATNDLISKFETSIAAIKDPA